MSETAAFTGGRILAMDPAVGEPDVVVLRDGRIAEVGPTDVLAAYPEARLVDLAGRTLLPGFIDAHHHLSIAALHPLWAELHDVTDLDEARRRLDEVARRDPDPPWIRGCRWDEAGTGLTLTRRELDDFGFDRPVLVGCNSYHRAVVSSAGLDALGISAATPDPPNGTIERDGSGQPDGRLIEGAWGPAHASAMRSYDDAERWATAIEARARTLLSYGITAVHDPAVSIAAERAYGLLAGSNRLPVSVLAMPHSDVLLCGLDESRLEGPPTGTGDELLRTGPVKLFADGAWELAIDAHVSGQPIKLGRQFPDLPEWSRAAVERGFGVAVHAMGNAGVRHALAAWESATRDRDPAHPLRIEHVTLVGSAEVERMLALGAFGVVQPNFVEILGPATPGDFDDARWMPFAELSESGVRLAASSDDPCSFSQPLIASRYGVTRTTSEGKVVGAEQTVPLETWLWLYTAGAAAAGEQQDERGRLAPGLRGDVVVLDGDPGRDGDVSVDQTWIDGELVYDRHATA